jgi:hypothetical protein
LARDKFPGEIRYNVDPDTGDPHFYSHNVSIEEVLSVLRDPLEKSRGREDSIAAIGQTSRGRYLKVIFSPDDDGIGIFVITAYDITDSQIRALRRRLRRRPR